MHSGYFYETRHVNCASCKIKTALRCCIRLSNVGVYRLIRHVYCRTVAVSHSCEIALANLIALCFIPVDLLDVFMEHTCLLDSVSQLFRAQFCSHKLCANNKFSGCCNNIIISEKTAINKSSKSSSLLGYSLLYNGILLPLKTKVNFSP
jgi:hypothetical protein